MAKQLPTSCTYQFLIEPGIWTRLSAFESDLAKFFKEHGAEPLIIQEVNENKQGIVWLTPVEKLPQVAQPDKMKRVKL